MRLGQSHRQTGRHASAHFQNPHPSLHQASLDAACRELRITLGVTWLLFHFGRCPVFDLSNHLVCGKSQCLRKVVTRKGFVTPSLLVCYLSEHGLSWTRCRMSLQAVITTGGGLATLKVACASFPTLMMDRNGSDQGTFRTVLNLSSSYDSRNSYGLRHG